jgi:hypothetical protein
MTECSQKSFNPALMIVHEQASVSNVQSSFAFVFVYAALRHAQSYGVLWAASIGLSSACIDLHKFR